MRLVISQRYILGGAWNEAVYMFSIPYAQSPFDRGTNVGFRPFALGIALGIAAHLRYHHCQVITVIERIAHTLL